MKYVLQTTHNSNFYEKLCVNAKSSPNDSIRMPAVKISIVNMKGDAFLWCSLNYIIIRILELEDPWQSLASTPDNYSLRKTRLPEGACIPFQPPPIVQPPNGQIALAKLFCKRNSINCISVVIYLAQ